MAVEAPLGGILSLERFYANVAAGAGAGAGMESKGRVGGE